MSQHDLLYQAAREEMLSNMASAFNDPTAFPDIEIVCEGQKWLCHKVILSKSSEWFDRAFGGNFKEHKAQSIELHEDSEGAAPAVEAMLRYCYSRTYHNRSSITFDVHMFALSEKYFIKHLGQHVAAKIQTELETLTTDIEDTYADLITQTYTTTADPTHLLRNTIISALLSSPVLEGFISSTTYKSLITSHPDFAIDITQALLKQTARTEASKNLWIKTDNPGGLPSIYNASTGETYHALPPIPVGFPPMMPPPRPGLMQFRLGGPGNQPTVRRPMPMPLMPRPQALQPRGTGSGDSGTAGRALRSTAMG